MVVEAVVERTDQPGLGRGQQFGQGDRAVAEMRAQDYCSLQVEADDDATRGDAQLAGAAQQRVPGGPAGIGRRLVREVGAELATCTKAPLGALPLVRRTATAVGGPAAEVPAGQRGQAFFSASSSSAGPR